VALIARLRKSPPAALGLRAVARLRRSWRPLLTAALGFLAVGLVVAGIFLIYPPAALIAGGVAIFAFLTFDTTAARRLTWPR
jgi:hypothetical protein